MPFPTRPRSEVVSWPKCNRRQRHSMTREQLDDLYCNTQSSTTVTYQDRQVLLPLHSNAISVLSVACTMTAQ